MQQHVGASREVLWTRVLDLVVADAALAGDEDHRGRAGARNVDRIVTGTAGQAPHAVPEVSGQALDAGDQCGVERAGREVDDFGQRDLHAMTAGDVAGVVAGFGIGVVASLLGVAGGELLIPTLVLL